LASDNVNREHLISQRDEFIKSYTTFDAQDRPEYIYTAPTDAADGTPCSQVQYMYRAIGSSQIQQMKESATTWQSAWDI